VHAWSLATFFIGSIVLLVLWVVDSWNLGALRISRSDSECRLAIEAVERAAREGDKLVPVVIGAVEKKATLGEISDALRHVFGEYQDASGA